MGLRRLIPVIAALGACTPEARVRGTLGGEEVLVETAMFSEHEAAFGEDGLVFVVLSELPNACATYAAYQQEAEALGDDDPDGLAELWARTFPEAFWEVVIVLRVADPDLSLMGQRYTGLAWYELLDLRSRFFARFTRNRAHRDAGWFDGQGATDDYLDEFLSHQGTLSIGKHEPGERIVGVVDTLVMDTDAVEPQGVVRVRFDATPCPGVLGL